jgi:putative transposase
VLEHLPERDRPAVKARLRKAWASENHQLALDGLQLLAEELERSHPGAAASLREGIAETLTLTRLESPKPISPHPGSRAESPPRAPCRWR